MRTAAILPVKRFAHAKQRLGASITEPLRARLAAAMVSDVLAAAGRSARIERTIVVTAERSVAREASSHGALVLDDSAQSGQSQAGALDRRPQAAPLAADELEEPLSGAMRRRRRGRDRR